MFLKGLDLIMSKKPKKPPRDFEEIFMNNDASTRGTKILWQMFSDKKPHLLLIVLFFIIKNSPVWIIPLITQNVVNAASTGGDNAVRTMIINFILAVIVLSQNIPMHALYIKQVSSIVREVEVRLRSSLVRKLQQLSITFHKDFKSGKIQSKILRDVEAIEDLLNQILGTMLTAVLSALISITITIYKSPSVAVFFILTIPLTVTIFNIFRGRMKRTTKAYRKEMESMSANVSEMVEMIPVTKAHGLGNIEVKKITSQFEAVKQKGIATDMTNAYFGSSAWVMYNIANAGCLLFTGFLAYKGKISIGEIVLYQTYFSQILSNVQVITNMYPNLAKGFESIVSVSEILASNDIEDNEGKKRITNLEGNYEFRNVDFAYSD